MKIAILGWGSLVWDPRTLKFDSSLGKNGWFLDGPQLPIEFARISSGGRLTLVIENNSKFISTLYSISAYNNFDEAILNLAIREGCGKSKIGVYYKEDSKCIPDNFVHKENISHWISNKDGLDGVIWTNLTSNFKERMGRIISEENAINYLKNIPLDIQAKAEEYIRKTPEIIDTSIRQAIVREFNWTLIR